MEQTNEYFTLETLGKFYADAAEAGGLERWSSEIKKWQDTRGPNLGSPANLYRPKPAPPIVRWLVRFEDKTPYPEVFDTERKAIMFEAAQCCWPRAKIIKLVEKQS